MFQITPIANEMYKFTIGTVNEELDAILPIFIIPSFFLFISYSEYLVTIHYQINKQDLSIHKPSNEIKMIPIEKVDLDYVSKNTIKYGNYYMQYDRKDKSIRIFPMSK